MPDHLPSDPSGWGVVKLILGPIAAAILGTLIRMVNGLVDGTTPSRLRVVADLLSAVGIGIVAAGTATWMGAHEIVAWALASAAGYLGPSVVIEMMVERWGGRRP